MLPEREGKETDPTLLSSLGERKLDVWITGAWYDIGAVGAVGAVGAIGICRVLTGGYVGTGAAGRLWSRASRSS